MAKNKKTERVIPRLQLLNQEQLKTVHQYSINILENIGIKVESKTALQIFKKSNGVKIDNEVVYIQGELVNYAIKKAPSNIKIYNKSESFAFNLGEKQNNETYFGIGVTNTHFQDIESMQVESFTRKHMQYSVQLGDMLNNFELISTLGIPSDVPPNKLDLYNVLDMYSNTTKPLVLLISETKNINKVFELLSFLHGNISTKPFCIPYFNPITPLVLNKSTTDKMIAAIEHRLPIMYSNYGMYGGSTPITEAGTFALLNAELLAGLVFGQLIREGTEMIMGSLPAAFNMHTMGSHYTPSTYLLNLACAEMMKFYKLPHCGTSGSSNAWGADLIASTDLWQNHLSSCIGKVGCAPFVGGSFDSVVFSPAMVVLSNEIIGEVRKFAKGFILNDETVNIKSINQTGHGGNYLTSEQTLASLTHTITEKKIWPHLSLDLWKEKGMPKSEKILMDIAKEKYFTAIKKSKENKDVIQKGENYILHKLS